MHVAGLARRVLAAERAPVRACGLQRRHDPPNRVLAEAGTDHADKGQMIAAMDPGHQRAEFAARGLPASEHHLLPGTAFGLGPALRAAGTIVRAELLGDDALQRQLARRFQNGVAAALEMFDIADRL